MIFTQRAVYWVLFSSLITLTGTVHESFMWAGFLSLCIFLITAVIEFVMLPKAETLRCRRILPAKFAFGASHYVSIEIQNYSGFALDVQVQDEPPEEFELRDIRFNTLVRNRKKEHFQYPVCPNRRGSFRFQRLHALVRFPFPGLIRKHASYLEPSEIKVYPDFNELHKFELLTIRGRLRQTGVRAVRQIGSGTDYESLRDYSPDDEYRRINWKATARLNRLMSTNYQVEKSQNVIVMMDCGRLMGTTAKGVSKLDHAANAAMILAHLAVKNGDLAGLLIFSNAVHSYLQPKRSKVQIGRIADRLAVVQSDYHESNYFEAFEHLKAKCHRRSLIVLFSEITDKESSAWLINGVLRLYPKHLCLCVLMKDRLMDEAVERKTDIPDDAFRKAVAAEWLTEREDSIASLRAKGVLVIDVLREHTTPALINEYIKVKMKSMI